MAARDASPGKKPTPEASQPAGVIGTGFLLSSLGAHASAQFAARVQPLGLTPPHVGLLWAITSNPGRSQQALADEFGMPPSRMVAFIDELEEKGLVERRRHERDRRVHSLYLTKGGEKTMRLLADVGRAAEEALVGSLGDAERRQLSELLRRVAESQQLTPGVHPGYRRMAAERPEPDAPHCT